jgi:hypothetical protein
VVYREEGWCVERGVLYLYSSSCGATLHLVGAGAEVGALVDIAVVAVVVLDMTVVRGR